MSVLTVADLIAHLGGEADDGKFQTYIDQAEAAVAAAIGADTLERNATEQTQYVQLEQNTRLFRLDEGPLESLVSVVDAAATSVAFTSETRVLTPWLLEYRDAAAPSTVLGAGTILKIGWMKGYEDAQLLDAMRSAILNTAQWIQERPAGGILSERIGDYSYTLRQAPGSLHQTLPPLAESQLWELRRPEFGL